MPAAPPLRSGSYGLPISSMDLPTTKQDLESLIKNRVQESLHLDYKGSRAISDGAQGEIAKDVSAFANADGGMIIYGIQENQHLPEAIDEGVDHARFSREWLEQVILDNINPRIDGLLITQIPLAADRSAFAVQIPKSYRGPHQDQSTKRYYKRYNFKSQPMEDYEISDLRSRALVVSPLVNVDVDIQHGVMVYIVISNIGNIPAENVNFKFSKELTWRDKPDAPPLLRRGIKYLPPSRKFRLFYHTFQDIVNDNNNIPCDFDVTVSYFHRAIGHETSDTFHIDIMDFMNTAADESDIYKHGRKIEDAIKKLTNELGKLNKNAEAISNIAGPTGINLSITTIRNLRHLIKNDEIVERIDPQWCEHTIFKEVLSIDDDLALRLRDFFWHRDKDKSLSEVEGMTNEILASAKRHFKID